MWFGSFAAGEPHQFPLIWESALVSTVMIPAGVIQDVDYEAETVMVNRTRDEVKASPRFDETQFSKPLRDDIGAYYDRRDDGL